MPEQRIYIPSFDDSARLQRLARAVMTQEAYEGWMVRSWLEGELITTNNDVVAQLVRTIATLHHIPIVEGDDIPEDPDGWLLGPMFG
jgi:hypothetical protein